MASVPGLRRIAGAASARLRRLSWRFGPVHPAPVFVLGNQKSGTTAIAALLAAQAGATAMLDIFFRLGDFAIEDRVLQGDFPLPRFVSAHRRFFRDPVIKDPSLTFVDRELRDVFPRARFLFVIRDPRDNIRSICNRLEIPGTVRGLEDGVVARALRDNPGWRSILRGIHPPTAGATVIETLANRWLLAASTYLARPEAFVLLRYEDFLADKIGALGGAARRLGLPPVRRVDELLDRQYQPRGDATAEWSAFFSGEQLAGILRICAPAMDALGYRASPSPDFS